MAILVTDNTLGDMTRMTLEGGTIRINGHKFRTDDLPVTSFYAS